MLSTFPLIADGTYPATITEVVIKEASNHTHVEVHLQVRVGEETLDIVKNYHLTTDKAVAFFRREMSIAGFHIKSKTDLANIGSKIPGTEVLVNAVAGNNGESDYYFTKAKASQTTRPAGW